MRPHPPERKMFSHSNKLLWTSAVPQRLPNTGIRGKVEASLKEKFRNSLAKLQQEHKYGGYIDRLVMQHAQEHNLPVITKSLSKKNQYTSCRIVKTEEVDSHPQPLTDRPSSRTIHKSQSQRTTFQSQEQSRELELPLIFKYRRNETVKEEQEERHATEQTDMESSRVLRLRELKQNAILKYIRAPQ